MAIVVWLFAGGGATEVYGLPVFLERNFGQHRFERKTPIVHKKAPRPPKYPPANPQDDHEIVSMTGHELSRQTRQILQKYWPGTCDLILVLDDLDCHDPLVRRQMFENAVRQSIQNQNIPVTIGFAVPEIEAWIIADWHNTFEKDREFRNTAQAQYAHQIRRELAEQYIRYDGSIDQPEQFSQFDPERDSCQVKLSDVLIEIVQLQTGINYSKADHSARMLKAADAHRVQTLCPEFRAVYIALAQ